MSSRPRTREDDFRNACPCPRCGCRSSRVLRTEPTSTGVRRRRECNACRDRFSTRETVLIASDEKFHTVTGDGVQTAQNSKG